MLRSSSCGPHCGLADTFRTPPSIFGRAHPHLQCVGMRRPRSRSRSCTTSSRPSWDGSITTSGSSELASKGTVCRWMTTGEPSLVSKAGKVRLRDVLKPRKTVIDYTYDFGDSWEHRLTVTDVRAGQPGVSYPRYIAGERNGPPEDCGGIPGFYELLEAITDPAHPSHAHLKEWARRLRSRTCRCTSDQIRPRAHRKPSQRRQGAPRQQKALRLGCLTAANKLAAAFNQMVTVKPRSSTPWPPGTRLSCLL